MFRIWIFWGVNLNLRKIHYDISYTSEYSSIVFFMPNKKTHLQSVPYKQTKQTVWLHNSFDWLLFVLPACHHNCIDLHQEDKELHIQETGTYYEENTKHIHGFLIISRYWQWTQWNIHWVHTIEFILVNLMEYIILHWWN